MLHAGFPTLLFDIERMSERREKWKRGCVKSRKSITGMRIVQIRQVLPKLQGFEHQHLQLEITAGLHIFV